MVEWKKLGEVSKRNKGIPITAGQMSELSAPHGSVRVFAAGQTVADINEEDLPSNCAHKRPSIIVKSRGYIDFEFYEKPFTHKNEMWSYSFKDKQTGKFIYYYLTTKTEFFRKKAKANSVKLPQLCVADTDNYLIPVPSLSEQQRIVGILDTFTSSIENLKEQITQRRKQYEYYRDQLLDLEGKEGVEMKEMWEVTAWDKRFQGVDKSMQSRIIPYTYLLAKDLFALAVPNGNIKLLSTGVQEGWTTDELAGDYLSEGEVVTIPWGKSPGAQNPVKYYKGKFVTGDNRIATSLDTNVLNNKFLYYWMYSKSDIIETFYRGAGIQHPSMFKILTMKVSIPPISEQLRIVSILDTFEASITNLEQQLAQREKQYEYYRNKLLTFE